MKKLLLKYSPEKAGEPILAGVIKETGVLVNILYADISAKGGEILVAIDAPEQDLSKVIESLKRKGVEVEEMRRKLNLDRESCMDCGACVSLCPTRALHLTADYSLQLDEDKCVYCELCISACPVRALKVSKFEAIS